MNKSKFELTNKHLSLLEVIIQGMLFLLIFFMPTYKATAIGKNWSDVDYVKLIEAIKRFMLHEGFKELCFPYATVAMILSILGVLAYFYFIKKLYVSHKVTSVLVSIEIALYVISVIIRMVNKQLWVTDSGEGRVRSFGLCFGFFILIIMMASIVAIDIYRAKADLPNEIIKELEFNVVNNDDQTLQDASLNVDEIIKYKKLLDAGAITEEEYNIKKKELLNL